MEIQWTLVFLFKSRNAMYLSFDSKVKFAFIPIDIS